MLDISHFTILNRRYRRNLKTLPFPTLIGKVIMKYWQTMVVIISVACAVGLVFFLNNVNNNVIALTTSVNNLSNNQGFSSISNNVTQSIVLISNGPLSRATGFILKSNGCIITNNHVINHPDYPINVTLQNGNSLIASVVNPAVNNLDLALIKIDYSGLQSVKLVSDVSTINNAAKVGFLGYPLGSPAPITNEGIVSFNGFLGNQRRIYVNAFVDGGNSGGPLFLADTGEVFGVVTGSVPSVVVNPIDFHANQSTNPDTQLILNGMQNMYNSLSVAIGNSTQSGMGVAIPIDNNIVSQCPSS